jgi:hypothetical protein
MNSEYTILWWLITSSHSKINLYPWHLGNFTDTPYSQQDLSLEQETWRLLSGRRIKWLKKEVLHFHSSTQIEDKNRNRTDYCPFRRWSIHSKYFRKSNNQTSNISRQNIPQFKCWQINIKSVPHLLRLSLRQYLSLLVACNLQFSILLAVVHPLWSCLPWKAIPYQKHKMIVALKRSYIRSQTWQ